MKEYAKCSRIELLRKIDELNMCLRFKCFCLEKERNRCKQLEVNLAKASEIQKQTNIDSDLLRNCVKENAKLRKKHERATSYIDSLKMENAKLRKMNDQATEQINSLLIESSSLKREVVALLERGGSDA